MSAKSMCGHGLTGDCDDCMSEALQPPPGNGVCAHVFGGRKTCIMCGFNATEVIIDPIAEQLWQPADTDAQGYEKFASALETQSDEMSAAMEVFEGHADVVAGFMCTASWLRRTAKAIRELGK